MRIRSIAIFIAVVAAAAAIRPLAAQTSPAEETLLGVLRSNAGVAEKCNACRELKTAGTERSIPALAALLTDAETSHAARFALESMEYPAAGAALRDALGKTTGLTKAGIIDSLGQRRDAQAVPLLAASLTDKEPQVVAAAATALGRIGTRDAAAALTAAREHAEGDAKAKLGVALVLCADRLRETDGEEAAKIYGAMSLPGEARLVRMAALRGLVQTAGSDTACAIAWGLLPSNDRMSWAAAAGELRNLSSADLRTVAADVPKLPAASQVAIIAAIRIRGDKTLAPIVLAAATSPHQEVRLAVARALCTVGDVTALPALVELAAADDPVGQTARQSLEAICGPKIDQQIIAAMRAEKDPVRRAGWIGVLQARRPVGVVGILLGEATEQGPEVRARALAALAKLAGAKDIPALVAIVLKTAKGPDREDAERAVQLVCRQIADVRQRAEPVLAIFRAAPAPQRVELLPLLGRIGGDAARQAIQQALDSQDPQLYEAGVRAISNWPDASVAEPLLQLARNAKAESHRRWALHAFIRVVSLPDQLPDAERLARLKLAIELSGQRCLDEHRRVGAAQGVARSQHRRVQARPGESAQDQQRRRHAGTRQAISARELTGGWISSRGWNTD
ncbi:MAG: HEAT repeat domain-containing protein [Thermoguttaceae bacterium]